MGLIIFYEIFNFQYSIPAQVGQVLSMQNSRHNLKLLTILTGLLLLLTVQQTGANSSSTSNAMPSGSIEKKNNRLFEADLTFSAGYRRDDLEWDIGGYLSPDHYVNVLSELSWDDIESFQVKFQGSLLIPNIIAFRGIANYGWIFDGDNQDSDYAGQDRTEEFSRSNNSADDGEVWDVSLAVGYPLRLGRFVVSTITPLVGYSHHEQNLDISDGHQTIPPTGPFAGLDSSYDTEWKGPWVGVDLSFRAAELKTFAHRFETFFSYEYHWADYDAEADWNLRDDFQHPKSFEHDTDGNGWIIRGGFNLVFQRHVALNFNFDYQDWDTDSGTDKVFFANGNKAKTRLNEVTWTSYSLGLGLSIRF